MFLIMRDEFFKQGDFSHRRWRTPFLLVRNVLCVYIEILNALKLFYIVFVAKRCRLVTV